MIHPLPLPFIYSRVAILSFIFQSVLNLLVITSYLMILNTIYMLMIPKFIPRFQITPWILVSHRNYSADVSTWMQKFVLQIVKAQTELPSFHGAETAHLTAVLSAVNEHSIILGL